MTADFTYSWASVERGCFEYLKTVLGSVEGVQAYTLEDAPRTMPSDAAQFFIWHFAINGGGKTIQRQSRDNLQAGTWQMDAQLVATCSSDSVAMLVGGMIENALPAGPDDVRGLARLYSTEFPSRERTTKMVNNADRAGDERIFFEVTIPMVAVFGNVERME